MADQQVRRDVVEDASRDHTDFWRVALCSIGDAVILADRRGVVTFMNPVAERLCGWRNAEAVGRQLTDVFAIVNESTRVPVENPVAKVIREGIVVGLANHTVLIRRDRLETPIDDSAAPIVNERGEISGAVLVFRDITEKRRNEELKARLAAIVESSDDIIVSKDLNGIITSWNKGAERILGYAADEIVGQHISVLMPEAQLEDLGRILEKVQRGERVDHYETKRRTKDGRIIGVSLTVSPIRNAYGEIVGASKVGRDITEKQRTHELTARLAAIIESSDDLIVSLDLDGVITSWNQAAQRILGYTAAEVIGHHIGMLMPPEQVEDYATILARIRNNQVVQHYETRRRRKDGSVVDVSLTVSPIRDAKGQVIGASKIGRDITQEKLVEAERKEAERRKDEFLAMLAHELRNPLASIGTAAQLLGRLKTQDELNWAKDIVTRQVHHLSRLIDDLLDVSRITRGKISLRKSSIDVAAAVESAVEAVRPLIDERHHELMVSLPAQHLQLNADPMRLEQMLVNLLTNSAKYTQNGGKIWLSVDRQETELVVSVRDTGIGIPPELLPRVFEIFVQGDRSMARSEGGLGIGLTLVQKLAHMHGGRVTAQSEGTGKGSEFVIRLPISEIPSSP